MFGFCVSSLASPLLITLALPAILTTYFFFSLLSSTKSLLSKFVCPRFPTFCYLPCVHLHYQVFFFYHPLILSQLQSSVTLKSAFSDYALIEPSSIKSIIFQTVINTKIVDLLLAPHMKVASIP